MDHFQNLSIADDSLMDKPAVVEKSAPEDSAAVECSSSSSSRAYEDFLLKLACAHPFGISRSFIQSKCEKEFPNRTRTIKDGDIIKILHKPSKAHQMTGLETIFFGPDLQKIIPPVETLAWMLFHRYQILVGQSPSGIIDVEDLDDLMKKNFGRPFAPESWGFPDFSYFYNFLFKHFNLYHKSAVLRKGKNDRVFLCSSHPMLAYLINCGTASSLPVDVSYHIPNIMSDALNKD